MKVSLNIYHQGHTGVASNSVLGTRRAVDNTSADLNVLRKQQSYTAVVGCAPAGAGTPLF